MFGYVTVNRSYLSEEAAARYDGFYCGLCLALKEAGGQAARTVLSNDMTFLTVLLSALYEEEPQVSKGRCLMHPLKTKRFLRNGISGYCAQMNLLLAYYNLLDDWKDDHDLRALAAVKALKPCVKRIGKAYPRQRKAVTEYVSALSDIEKKDVRNADAGARLTGQMLAEVFAMKEDEWAGDLRAMGHGLGRFIYMMDAYEDVDRDLKNGLYNPFSTIRTQPDFDDRCKEVLMFHMADCARAFERLPILQDTEILRNILYSGVWMKFAFVYRKRTKTGEDE